MNTSLWHFELVCPKCNKISETTGEQYSPPPRVNCGDCLVERVEVVEMKVLIAERRMNRRRVEP